MRQCLVALWHHFPVHRGNAEPLWQSNPNWPNDQYKSFALAFEWRKCPVKHICLILDQVRPTQTSQKVKAAFLGQPREGAVKSIMGRRKGGTEQGRRPDPGKGEPGPGLWLNPNPHSWLGWPQFGSSQLPLRLQQNGSE